MTISIDLAVYPLDLILRACHPFTSRCYVVPHAAANGRLAVEFIAREKDDTLHDLAGSFANTLLDTRLRVVVAEETRAIRELLVAQAFCEADLLDRREADGDEAADPRGIVP